MVPLFIVVALGFDATDALVYSQAVLSFALPVPTIALVILTRRDIMGQFANRRWVAGGAVPGTVVILALNAVLFLQTFGVTMPGL